MRGLEPTEVRDVFAPRTGIDRSVELETDLIESTRKAKRQCPVHAADGTLVETVRQTKAKQVSRSAIQPAVRKAVKVSDIADRLRQFRGQRIRRREPVVSDDRNDIEIERRPIDESEKEQPAAAHDGEVECMPARSQYFAEGR